MSGPKGLQKYASSEDKADAFEINFGTRRVSRLKTSRIVAIPKQALANFVSVLELESPANGTETTDNEISQVNVSLVQQANGDRFIKLRPILDEPIMAVKAKESRRK